MKLKYSIQQIGYVISALTLGSCGHSANDLMRARNYGYQSGLAAGRAAEVRQDYHDEQRAKEKPYALETAGGTLLPALPDTLPRKRFYEVPIPEHIASDGVKIEAHTQNIEVIQP